MGRRLLAFLREQRTTFENAGFVWKGDTAPVKSADIVLPDWLKQK
jgi:hypothetical protein